MNFEKDFPELEAVCTVYDCYDNCKIEEHQTISKESVQRHCLDKQRVKEALYKAGLGVQGEDKALIEFQNYVLKDLGLEDNK